MDTLEDNYNSPEEKMKRMSIAVKGVGGWFSYFMGMATLIVGTLNILELYKFIDPFVTFFGVPITLGGIYLIILHFIQKKFTGKLKIVKLFKMIGLFSIIPGALGLFVFSKESNKYETFVIMAIIGFVLILTSMLLKKIWKIKTPKRKRRTLEDIENAEQNEQNINKNNAENVEV